MIVLDTNVLSELFRPIPSPAVLEWFARYPRTALFTTSVTQGEILYGIQLLPDGQRRTQLADAAQAVFDSDFDGRVLSFDGSAASEYAVIAAARRSQGRPISQFDAQIAAIARSRNAALATRNIVDFEGCGITLVNPWV